MTAYYGSKKIKKVYLGTQNTNCLTHIPNDINLELTYGAWTQPTFSSNTNGGLTLSASHEAQPAWYAFNGNKTTNDNCWWTNHGVTSTSNPCWIQLKSTTKLKLNQVVIRNEHQTPENFKTAYLQVSNNGSSWTNVATISGTNTGSYETTVNFTVSDGYYYYRLYFTESYSTSGVSIQTLTFSGTAQNTLTLKKGSKVYVPNGWTSYKYYKATYGSWTRPNLTSNTSNTSFTLADPKLSGGTLSGTTMTWGSSAVTRFTDVWKSFDSDTSSYFTINNGSLTFTVFDIIFSDYMKVSGVTITGNVVNSQASALSGSQIYALKDDGSYTLLSTKTDGNVNTHTFTATRTRRLRICARPGADGNGYPSRLTNITITAQKQTGGTESTSSDYDYKVGSGSMIFDEVVISKDLTYSQGYNDTRPLMINANGTAINGYTVAQTFSGSTAPTGSTYMFWYDTANNIITETHDSGATWGSTKYSFPFSIIKGGSGSVTSIDQTFNGFGYIGSTVFALPGVKGLIPRGFNDDGTYKNIEVNTTSVKTWYNNGYTFTDFHLSFCNSSGDIAVGKYIYDKNTNTTNEGYSIIGNVSGANGKITSLTPNPVQPEKTGRKISRIYKGSTLVYGYGVNEVIFEKSTSGTATVNIEYDGYYELTVIGGGSGGAFEYSAKYADGAAGGGSGAGLIGVAYLTKGSYSVTVGAGGAGKWDNNASETVTASAGGASKFGSIVTAGGGSAPKAVYNGGTQTAGAGGTLSYTSSAFRSTSLAKNGNAGTTNNNASTNTAYSGGAAVYGGYGAGGKAQYGGAYAGGTGYVKVVAI